MASPIGHTLTGLAIGRLAQPKDFRETFRWLLFAAFASNAPDLDFIAGIVGGGGINSVHRGPSHSIVAAIVFSAFMAAILGRWWQHRQRIFWTSLALYGSHLFLDMCTHSGIPLLWPLSTELYSLPVAILVGIDHGTPGATVNHFVWHLTSLRNVQPLLLELLLFVPLFLIAFRLRGSGLSLAPAADSSSAEQIYAEQPPPPESPSGDAKRTSLDNLEPSHDPSETMSLEQLSLRVNQLQRQVKWTQVALLAAVALIPLIVILLRNYYGSSISAEQFVLHDVNGTPRAALVLNEGVEPYLIFFGNSGEDRAVIGVDRHGKPLMGLLDENEVTKAAIRLDENDRPILALLEDGNRRAVLQVDDDGLGKLVFGKDDDSRIQFP